MMVTKLKTAPAVEPVTLTELKLHLRLAVDIEGAETYIREDALLTRILKLAREEVEFRTARKLITQTWYGYLDVFPSENYILVPFPPLQTATLSYKEEDGTINSFTGFDTDAASQWGRLVLKPDESWPTETLYDTNPITIEFVCGYGTSGDYVPDCIKQAILLVATGKYEIRGMPHQPEDALWRAVDALLDRVSVRRFGSSM